MICCLQAATCHLLLLVLRLPATTYAVLFVCICQVCTIHLRDICAAHHYCCDVACVPVMRYSLDGVLATAAQGCTDLQSFGMPAIKKLHKLLPLEAQHHARSAY